MGKRKASEDGVANVTLEFSPTDDGKKKKSKKRKSLATGKQADPGLRGSCSTMSEDDRKLFVGGISRDTTELGLNDYFSIYGQLESCKLITDRETGQSKGFGFIVFYEEKDLESVLAQETHNIDGRDVTPRRATPGGGGRGGGRGRGGYGGGRGGRGGGYGGGGW